MQGRSAQIPSISLALLLALAGGVSPAGPGFAQPRTAAPSRLRLYVLDCGVINVNGRAVERYNLKPEEVSEPRLVVPCFLIAHPRGTLMWELGVIPDETVEARARGEEGNPTAFSAAISPVKNTLHSQLADIGYEARDITYFAFSHAHADHSANANAFAGSTWLANPMEAEFMWQEGNERVNPTFYGAIAGSARIVVDHDDYDVFGDGKVLIKSAPGHSPGHQVLVLDLERTGHVMLGGDLYHYPEERALRRPAPTNEADREQSAASRAAIESYLARTGTELWIEHDFAANARLKKSPDFYE